MNRISGGAKGSSKWGWFKGATEGYGPITFMMDSVKSQAEAFVIQKVEEEMKLLNKCRWKQIGRRHARDVIMDVVRETPMAKYSDQIAILMRNLAQKMGWWFNMKHDQDKKGFSVTIRKTKNHDHEIHMNAFFRVFGP